MIEILVAVIAAAQLGGLALGIVRLQRRAAATPAPARDRPPPVYLPPPYCGRAASWDGATGPCARRAGHSTRCMLDAELEHLAEHGGPALMLPAMGDAPSTVDIAALGRHVDSCPTSLFANGALCDAEIAWIVRTRVMVDALVTGEQFSDWGDTRA